MSQVGEDVLQTPLQHPSHLDHGLEPTAHGPATLPAKTLPRHPHLAPTTNPEAYGITWWPGQGQPQAWPESSRASRRS
jgi:hypothetical protein